MNNLTFELEGEFIELIKLLKVLRIAESGGQAKLFVDEGEVIHNGEPEFRKRAKLRKGDTVQIFNILIKIT
ncbi:MAG: RNA-binding S4 domain-containing protein [Prolixibacteraceae bacterium]|nr:RNA-binding S4 domain-containing protein [Prolixibacteraceae bacterium]